MRRRDIRVRRKAHRRPTAQGGALRPHTRDRLQPALPAQPLHIPPRRLDVLPPHSRAETTPPLRSEEHEGIRRRPPQERNHGRRSHHALSRHNPPHRDTPHNITPAHRHRPLRPPRQLHPALTRDTQPHGRRRRLTAQRHRQHTDSHGRPAAETMDDIPPERPP